MINVVVTDLPVLAPDFGALAPKSGASSLEIGEDRRG